MAEQRSIKLIAPHGGVLINRLLDGEMRDAMRERAQSLARIPLTPLNVADLECVSTGVYSPLTGYMGEADYKSVMFDMHLTNGLPWTVPVTLAVDEELANRIKIGQSVALAEPVEGDGERLLAVLTVTEKFKYDKQLEAEKVFRTTDAEHPGVARIYAQGDVYLAGDIWVFDRPLEVETTFTDIRFTPADTRRMFVERGWRRIVAFQTRNPIHRAHEYLQKVALEVVDGLMLHPLVGETKSDDVPADVRVASYQAILETYYPMDRVLLNVFPAAMRYGGRAKRSSTPSPARITAARTSSSGAITPGSASITAPTTRTTFSTNSIRARWTSRRCSSSTPSTAASAKPSSRPRPARTARMTGYF